MLSFAIGHSVSYLTGPIAAGREGYYVAAVESGGEPPGLWYGAGAEALGLRGEVDNDLMEAVYSNFLDPTDPASRSQATWGEARTLGNAAPKYRTAERIYRDLVAQEPDATPERRAELQEQAENKARQAVQFFDMTFSPGKSVTVLAVAFERCANEARAAGDEKAAAAWTRMHKAVEDAVMAGARASIDFLQDEAGYSRVGKHGGGAGRWTDAHGYVVAHFLQHDSREKDPQLHVHQAILNRALGADGQWHGVDGRALSGLKGAAGAVGERVMEAELARVLGVRFVSRPDGHGREIVGVSREVMDLFSTRRREIGPRAQELCREFARATGREPTALERSHISQRATLATRRAKAHEREDPAARIARWEAECRAALSGGLQKVARTVLHARGGEEERWSETDVLERAVALAAEKKQTWTRGDLLRAVSDSLPANLGMPPERVRSLLESVTDTALRGAVRITPEERVDDLPAELRLANGRSCYSRPSGDKFAAPGQLAAEHELRGVAYERGAVALSGEEAQAVVDRFAENGKELGADQKAAVLGVLTSGARVEAMAAPAGTGKSFTVGALADGWRGYGRQVYGLAPGQAQADILTGEGLQSWNTTRWLSGKDIPPLQAGDLVVVDEAGMASTPDLAAVAERCRAADAKLLLVGDKQQLAAVGAGGAFADLTSRAPTYELTEVRRFREGWEKEASLRLRERDRRVLVDYDKHGRIRAAGTQEQAASAAARAWLADTVAGKEALLVVGSNEDAYRASAQLRAELVRLGRVKAEGVRMGMDQNTAGVGDMVQGRRNGWELVGWEGNERCPINRESYRVVAVREDGGLTVEPAKGGPKVQLPAGYVAEHLTLAYASTVHAAEGRTVDTAHGVVSAGTDAGALYVLATRGREANTMWVVSRQTNQEAPAGEAHDVEHRAAKAVLTDILGRAEEPLTALGEKDAEEKKAVSVMTAVEKLASEVEMATAGRTSTLLDMAAATGAITDEQRVALAADPAMGGLERLLRQAEVAGHDPAQVLGRALQGRSLDSATSPAAVLHHRIRETTPLEPRLQSAADLVPRGLSEEWQTRLSGLAEDIDNRRRELGAQAATERPKWAVKALGPVPSDVVARQEWESRAGWAAAQRELASVPNGTVGPDDVLDPLGAAPPAGLVEKHAVWRTAHLELDLPDRGPEEAKMSDGRLRNRVAAFERERAWAPRYVGDELSATAEAQAKARTDAQLWAERAEREELPDDERAQLRAAAEKATREAEELAEREAQLEEADKARTSWFLHTAVTRDNAERARAELAARGRDLEGERKVSGEEWLRVHGEAMEAEDEHREVAEADLAEDVEMVSVRQADGSRLVEGAETAVPDAREAEAAEAEHDDVNRRRVPDAESAAASVARARDALLEIEARNVEDEEREAEAAQWQPVADDAAEDAHVDVMVR